MIYNLWVFVHLLGVFGFLIAHGTSATVGLRLRKERDRDRIRGMLDLSAATTRLMYWSLLALLVGGVAAGFSGKWWGQGWIWASLGLLVALTAVLGALAVPYYVRIRRAVGAPRRRRGAGTSEPAQPATPEELAALLSSSRPVVLAVVGGAGLVLLLWLMILKPL